MKNFKPIIGTSFLALIISLVMVNNLTDTDNYWKYLFPVLIIAFVNIAMAIYYFYKRNKTNANTFILSSLLVLIIGGSSCVTIKFKEKKPSQKKLEKKENSVKPNGNNT